MSEPQEHYHMVHISTNSILKKTTTWEYCCSFHMQ